VEPTAAADKFDPIHQFGINPIFDIGTIGGVHIAFTNFRLCSMAIAVLLISALLILGHQPRARWYPGRIQSLAEISYEFVANMLRETPARRG